MDKKAVIRNFSRYAYVYDRYADVQKRAALELLKEVKNGGFDKILEIGCGTGNYTLLLRDKFRNAGLKAIDISDKMVEVASEKLKMKEVEFLIADAENTGLDGEFDLITSNACFQWFADLEKALVKYKNLLKKNGVILFSVFGPSTFRELNTSLEYVLENESVYAAGFITKEKIGEILNKHFKEIKIKETRYSEYFFRLKDLLDKIKYSGIRGEGGANGRISFTRKLLKELEKTYLDKFLSANHSGKQIKATYQIFFCAALKA